MVSKRQRRHSSPPVAVGGVIRFSDDPSCPAWSKCLLVHVLSYVLGVAGEFAFLSARAVCRRWRDALPIGMLKERDELSVLWAAAAASASEGGVARVFEHACVVWRYPVTQHTVIAAATRLPDVPAAPLCFIEAMRNCEVVHSASEIFKMAVRYSKTHLLSLVATCLLFDNRSCRLSLLHYYTVELGRPRLDRKMFSLVVSLLAVPRGSLAFWRGSTPDPEGMSAEEFGVLVAWSGRQMVMTWLARMLRNDHDGRAFALHTLERVNDKFSASLCYKLIKHNQREWHKKWGRDAGRCSCFS
jgi:hypothetical protein